MLASPGDSNWSRCLYVSESVDYIFRDGADTPTSCMIFLHFVFYACTLLYSNVKHFNLHLGAAVVGQNSEMPECMERYTSNLKKRYMHDNVLSDEDEYDWLPRVTTEHTEIVTIEHKNETKESSDEQAELLRFGNVDKILERKRSIKYEEIFSPPDEGRFRVLIDGAPGVGKSTFCKKIARDWANGSVQALTRFDIVLLVPLRAISEAKNEEDIFRWTRYTDDEETLKVVIESVKRNKGEGILLLLDGFDELSPDLREKSFFVDLVDGRRTRSTADYKYTVFVTSRPYASQKLQKMALSRHIEILGFREEQVRACILSAFPEPEDRSKADNLMQEIEVREDIMSLCYIPMNCTIMISVYKLEDCHLPNTLTELYKMFLTHALHRHAMKIGLVEDDFTIEELPSELEIINALAEIAYKFLREDKFVFSRKDLGTNITQLQIIGLVTSFQRISGYGSIQCYQFLHLTIQEFLAAWHASKLDLEEQAHIISDFTNERFKLMRYFLAGITELNGEKLLEAFLNSFKMVLEKGPVDYSTTNNRKVQDVLEALSLNTPNIKSAGKGLAATITDGRKEQDGSAILDHLHMIYETKSHKICKKASEYFPEKVIHFNSWGSRILADNSPFLCKVVSFFLCNSSCAWKKIDLEGLISDSSCLRALYAADCSSSVKEVILHREKSRGVSRETGIHILSCIPKIHLFRNIESLSVASHSVVPPGEKSTLADLFCIHTLKRLAYFDDDGFITNRHYVTVRQFEKPPHISKNLQDLHLEWRCFDPEIMSYIGSGVADSNIIKFSLTMPGKKGGGDMNSSCNTAIEMIVILLPCITEMKQLEHLILNVIPDHSREQKQEHEPQDSELAPLFTLLKFTKTLKKLEIHSVDVFPAVLNHLLPGLRENSTLSELHITVNTARTCDLFEILQTIIKIQSLSEFSLAHFDSRAKEVMKLWNVLRNYLSQFQVLNTVLEKNNLKFCAVRKSEPISALNACMCWKHAFTIDETASLLQDLSSCQSLSMQGRLTLNSAPSMFNLKKLPANSPVEGIGKIIAHFLLNGENCHFDFSNTYENYTAHFVSDPDMLLTVPLFSTTDFPRESVLLHDNIIHTKFEYSNVISTVEACYIFDLHLQPVTTCPPNKHHFPATMMSLKQIVSPERCHEMINSHAEKCSHIFKKLSSSSQPKEAAYHNRRIYVIVDLRIMKSDHTTVKSRLTWTVGAYESYCPYQKYSYPQRHFDRLELDDKTKQLLQPQYFEYTCIEEDIETVVPLNDSSDNGSTATTMTTISGVSLTKEKDTQTQLLTIKPDSANHSGRKSSSLHSVLAIERRELVDSVAVRCGSFLCDNGFSSDVSTTAIPTTITDDSVSQDGDNETGSQPTKLNSEESSGSTQNVHITTVVEAERLDDGSSDDGSTIANMITIGYGSAPQDGDKNTQSHLTSLDFAEYCVGESSTPIATMVTKRKRPIDTYQGAKSTLSLKKSEILAPKSEEQGTVLDSVICTPPPHSKSSSNVSLPDMFPENRDQIIRYKICIYYIFIEFW